MAFTFTYTAAILTIIFVCIAVFLFLKGRRDSLTSVFLMYVLASAVWIGGNVAADISYTKNALVFTSALAFAGGTFIVTFFLIFVDLFIDGRMPSAARRMLYVLPSVLLTIFSFSKYGVAGTFFPIGEPAQIIPGIQYYFSIIFLFGGLFYGLRRLMQEYAAASGKRKLQTLYISIGFAGLFIGEAIFSVLLPVLGELRFFNVAPQFSVIFVIAAGYAIYKHNLLDIRIVIQRGLIYSILFISIVGVYVAGITLSALIFQQETQAAILVSAGLTTLLGIFTVPHIDRYLRKKTDRLFFKDTYNYSEALYMLSATINQKVLLEDIKVLTQTALMDILKTTRVITLFASKDQAHRIAQEIRQNQTSRRTLLIPIEQNGELIGTIFLGEKRSGDLYTQEDIVLIKTFSHQIAGAFEKAKLYQEVQEYSQELELKVAERTQQIRQLQERQTQMMLDISHKLQNPLTIVKTELGLLRMQMPGKQEFVFFEKTIDDISAFIYDLLHLARFELAPDYHERSLQDLSDHLAELIEYFSILAKQKNIELRSSIADNIEFVYNKKDITELITNLVSNAMKYIGNEGADGHKWIEIRLYEKDSVITLTVEDNGIGIDEAEIPHIFDRFYRTSETQHASVKGTGLGLAISKKIAQVHNGDIRVQSQKSKGACFTVEFKRAA